MFHWADGIEIDLRDDADSGMSLTFGAGGITMFKAINGSTTVFRRANWDG